MNNKFIESIKYRIQHYNPKKYWKYRSDIVNKRGLKIIRLYKLMKIKKMDAFNNASLGTNLDVSAEFKGIPNFPHGLNGIFVNQFAKIGVNCTIFHQVTIGSNDTKTAPNIGNNVIIYPGAKVIGDITIGDNCVIGAGAVVNKSFPANKCLGGGTSSYYKRKSQY